MQQLKSIYRRLVRGEARRTPPAPDLSGYKQTLEKMRADFRARTAGINCPGLEHFCWYHTVDLGKGLVTPGVYDYRNDLQQFNFPSDMTGMTALDIGAATGFYSFAMEKR